MTSQRKTVIKEEKTFVKPDGGDGWTILLAVSLIGSIAYVCLSSLFVAKYSWVTKNEGMSLELVSHVQNTNSIVIYLSGPLVSVLTRLFSVRWVVLVSATVNSIVYASYLYLPSSFVLLLLGVVSGIAFSCTYNSLFIILVDYFDNRLGIANAIANFVKGLGIFVLMVFSPLLVVGFDLKITMVVLGCINLICSILAILLRPIDSYGEKGSDLEMKKLDEEQARPESQRLNNKEGQNRTDGEDTTPSTHVDHRHSSHNNKINTREIFMNLIRDVYKFYENKVVLMVLISNFFTYLVYSTPLVYIPKRVAQLGITNDQYILPTFAIFGFIFGIVFVLLADRKIFTTLNMYTFCILISAIAMYVYYFLTSLLHQLLFAVAYSFINVATTFLTIKLLVEIIGSKSFANLFGILLMLQGLGLLIHQFLIDFIDKNAGMFYVFLASGISLTIAFVLSVAAIIIRNQSSKTNKEEAVEI